MTTEDVAKAETLELAGIKIPLERCHFWMDPTGFIFMSIPNDDQGNFLCMYDGKTINPNAYGAVMYKFWGWECLGPVQMNVVAQALAEMD